MVSMWNDISACLNPEAKEPDEFQTNFIRNGMLQIPIEYLPNDLLLKMVNLILNHLKYSKEAQPKSPGIISGSSIEDPNFEDSVSQTTRLEAQQLGFESGEIPKKSSGRENRIRMCSFCRKRHIIGYSYCPAYGRRCSNCGCLNHIKRACWHLYPEFSRFKEVKANQKCSGTRRNLNGELGAILELKDSQSFGGKFEELQQSSQSEVGNIEQEIANAWKEKETPCAAQLKETANPKEIERTLNQEELKETPKSNIEVVDDNEDKEVLNETRNSELSNVQVENIDQESEVIRVDPKEEYQNELDDEGKYALMAEKYWAMKLIDEHQDIEWFELPNTKAYYTRHGGGLLRMFIEKFKQVKKLEEEKRFRDSTKLRSG